VGKEGDDLYRQLADPGAIKGDELNIYRLADTWTPILERALTLGAPELIARGVPSTTAYAVISGNGQHTAETRALVTKIVNAPQAAPRGLWRPCACPGCRNIVKRPQVWCGPGCKKAVQRAEERFALHARSAKRCRRCGTIRYGDTNAPCPTCAQHVATVVDAISCRYCGSLRVGDTTGPCPVCQEASS